MTIGHNSTGQIKSIVDRVERIEMDLLAVQQDRKEIYAEAKANGYDVPALKAVVKIRKQDKAERQEREAIVQTYLDAVGE